MTPPGQVAAAKRAVRSRLLIARGALDSEAVSRAADQLADRVAVLVAQRGSRCVSTYVSLDGEPGTLALLDRLDRLGVDILLPLLLPDRDLDWALYRRGTLRPGPLGLLQPTTQQLGLDALATADVIVCPGVAGTLSGDRLGRGGGSYDRALARSGPASLRCLLLYDNEVLDDVPTDVHDQRVDVLVTPTRTLWTSPRRS